MSRYVEGDRIQTCLKNVRKRLAAIGFRESRCCGQVMCGNFSQFDYIKIHWHCIHHYQHWSFSLAKFTVLFAYFRHGFHLFGIPRHVCCRAISTMGICETSLFMLNTNGGYTSAHPIHTLHLSAHTYIHMPKDIRRYTHKRMHINMYNGGDDCAEEEACQATLRGRILSVGWQFERRGLPSNEGGSVGIGLVAAKSTACPETLQFGNLF